MSQQILRFVVVLAAVSALVCSAMSVELTDRFAEVSEADITPPKAAETIPKAHRIAEIAVIAQLYWCGGRPLDAVQIYESLARVYGAELLPE